MSLFAPAPHLPRLPEDDIRRLYPKMRWQILELEGKLAGMRRDRIDTFQAGRKAGYLPGELEGRGIVR